MPRYFFNVHDGRSTKDEEGTELPDLETARRTAVKFSGECLTHSDSWKGDEWRLEVADATGLVLFSMKFQVMDAPAAPGAALPVVGSKDLE